MGKNYKIAVIAGDGIGKEVVPEGQRVVEAAARRFGFSVDWTEFDWNCDYYARHGRMMPEDGVEQVRGADAIFLGAVGWPTVPDHISTWDLILKLRRELGLYVALRPARLLKGIVSPLAGRTAKDIDFVIVRENSEGEYSAAGGLLYEGTSEEMVIQESVFSKRAIDRILRYAFDLARTRRKKVSLATKSNGIKIAMPYWDARFAAIAREYPDVAHDKFHIDILTAHFVVHPDWFDVVVGSNLFGDILSDLGPAVAGSIGIAPSGNIDPSRTNPSMFEPVHGSAPDIAGQGIANPIGQIWAAAMMLEHLGELEAAKAIETAIESVIGGNGPRTRDLGGNAATVEAGKAIAEALA
ncbi:tartrate dehydrogenase [Allomesorhizobium camelthorni]|uniref:D-malate dehydrogenase [decarboxylating] n=1 Tax=Allomesorhizobium camelthorni TaxID=475069 RepID=A0A6G4WAT1_9HYPH|nr:tartrate dehydrogenase [Mesorhizobium camelthorni]NGO51346.1 tartrate dehydrogenase [Mesorhizobium camelthorni]